MVYKITFNYWGFVVASKCEVLSNPHGGLQSLKLSGLDDFWTGHVGLSFYNDSWFTIQLTNVNSVYKRSSLNEDDEQWIEYEVPHESEFKYETYKNIAIEIEAFLKEPI